MYRKLIFLIISLCFFSCTEVSTNLLYYKDLRYKYLFTNKYSNNNIYSCILFVENYKTNNTPSQQSLEDLAIYFVSNPSNKKKKIVYIKYIDYEFAEREYVDEYVFSTVFLDYKNGEIKIKKSIKE